jgi:anti-sigma regulatory factor (Ser/Thr protein kinase)
VPRAAHRRVLVLRNADPELRRMSLWFRGFAGEVGLPEAKALDVELCLDELVANVVQHAYTDGGEHEITLTLETHDGELLATIEDDGPPFDPRQAPDPERPSSLDDATIGGWGLPIVRAFADEVLYERRAGRNRVTIVAR